MISHTSNKRRWHRGNIRQRAHSFPSSVGMWKLLKYMVREVGRVRPLKKRLFTMKSAREAEKYFCVPVLKLHHFIIPDALVCQEETMIC